MIWLYRKHLALNYDKYRAYPIPQKKETFFSFERWKVLYEADEENWDFYMDKYDKTIVPFYNGEYGERYYIKFLTRKDFKKFIKYIRIKERTGQTEENIQEQLFLVEQISKNLKRKNKELLLKAALKEDKKENNDYSLKLESGDKTYEFPYR